MITREEAVYAIYQVINSGILDLELENDLTDVANCIEAEETYNLFLWGAEDDYLDLFTDMQSDLIDDKWISHRQALYEKYKIREVENDDSERIFGSAE